MKLSAPANYDLELIGELASHPVSEVYGKLAVDLVGGGRPSYMACPVTKRQLAEYVAELGRHGIAFNYLLNSSCLGNCEWDRRWQKRLMRFLEGLGKMGIRHLTVSTPYLLELIKARFPVFKLRVGIYAQIDTPRRARFWAGLGADAMTLESFSINRDFAALEAIRAATDCELTLIANHCCLPNCALQPYHQNGFAHSSAGSRRLFIDYCFLHCSRLRLEDPSRFIKAAWIRPEDLAFYEAMGYANFKLIERGMPSEDLLRRVRAYSERRYRGNLADLILPYGFKQPQAKPAFWRLRHFFRPAQVSPRKLLPLFKLVRQQGMLFPQEERPITIDAASIPPDFVSSFRQRRCAQLDCRSCGYCEAIGEQAVTVQPAFREESLQRRAEVSQALNSGSLWGVRPTVRTTRTDGPADV